MSKSFSFRDLITQMLSVDPMVVQITCFPHPQLQPRAGGQVNKLCIKA